MATAPHIEPHLAPRLGRPEPQDAPRPQQDAAPPQDVPRPQQDAPPPRPELNLETAPWLLDDEPPVRASRVGLTTYVLLGIMIAGGVAFAWNYLPVGPKRTVVPHAVAAAPTLPKPDAGKPILPAGPTAPVRNANLIQSNPMPVPPATASRTPLPEPAAAPAPAAVPAPAAPLPRVAPAPDRSAALTPAVPPAPPPSPPGANRPLSLLPPHAVASNPPPAPKSAPEAERHFARAAAAPAARHDDDDISSLPPSRDPLLAWPPRPPVLAPPPPNQATAATMDSRDPELGSVPDTVTPDSRDPLLAHRQPNAAYDQN